MVWCGAGQKGLLGGVEAEGAAWRRGVVEAEGADRWGEEDRTGGRGGRKKKGQRCFRLCMVPRVYFKGGATHSDRRCANSSSDTAPDSAGGVLDRVAVV